MNSYWHVKIVKYNPVTSLVLVLSLAVMLAVACGESQTASNRAPDFSLQDSGGHEVVLAELLEEHEAVVIIFYRGFF